MHGSLISYHIDTYHTQTDWTMTTHSNILQLDYEPMNHQDISNILIIFSLRWSGSVYLVDLVVSVMVEMLVRSVPGMSERVSPQWEVPLSLEGRPGVTVELRTLESFRLGTPGGDLRISNNNIRSSPGYGFYFRDIMGINISIFAIPKPTLLIYNLLWSKEVKLSFNGGNGGLFSSTFWFVII